MALKIENYIKIGLALFIIYMLYDSFVYNNEIASIKENPVFVMGKINNVEQHTNGIVVYFDYSYKKNRYSNKETLIPREYKELRKKSGPIMVILNRDNPKVSRIVFKAEDLKRYSPINLES
ncbi:hypothetical protein [Aureispira anguillae]|uniref:Uncharacterized protein n=1 Tax=Aureispira anguillae TaxID=2864201 RepID=A0A916DRJ0_9BACT|nr:hypothetical protein [Aureispira anguillae]BDS10675.1 hypothetical protein AsAng_0013840 [Aureispira anguillae]